MDKEKERTLQRGFNIYCSWLLGWELITDKGIEFYTENGKHIHSIYSYDPYENLNQMAVVFDLLPKIMHTENFVDTMHHLGIKKAMRSILMAQMILNGSKGGKH